MTVVIADSSPLIYLALLGSVDVLHRLYGNDNSMLHLDPGEQAAITLAQS